jgi:hypothetical protein
MRRESYIMDQNLIFQEFSLHNNGAYINYYSFKTALEHLYTCNLKWFSFLSVSLYIEVADLSKKSSGGSQIERCGHRM